MVMQGCSQPRMSNMDYVLGLDMSWKKRCDEFLEG